MSAKAYQAVVPRYTKSAKMGSVLCSPEMTTLRIKAGISPSGVFVIHVSVPDKRVVPEETYGTPTGCFSVAAHQTIPVLSAGSFEQDFRELADRWRKETAILSSITAKSMHPAYQQIIGMGPKVLPLILRELRRKPGHWFWALTALTGDDPVPAEDAGDIEKMTQAWLEYGRKRGWA